MMDSYPLGTTSQNKFSLPYVTLSHGVLSQKPKIMAVLELGLSSVRSDSGFITTQSTHISLPTHVLLQSRQCKTEVSLAQTPPHIHGTTKAQAV